MIEKFTIDKRTYYTGFTQGYTMLKDKPRIVTTCVLRTKKPMITLYGNTIMNDKDKPDNISGHKWAFKRAVTKMGKYAVLLSIRDEIKDDENEFNDIFALSLKANKIMKGEWDKSIETFEHACHLAWHLALMHSNCAKDICIDTSKSLDCPYCIVDNAKKHIPEKVG